MQTLRHRGTRYAGMYLADRAHDHLTAITAAVKLYSSSMIQAEAALVQQRDLNKCLEAIAVVLGAAKVILFVVRHRFEVRDSVCVCLPLQAILKIKLNEGCFPQVQKVLHVLPLHHRHHAVLLRCWTG